ncbi:ABC transporter substrate-binding protein [Gordonia neofelifaecis]|uniref:Branched-chain amino acid transport system substrate-binding protein n=1 Tax=Gordonia neofelifaecis NRRL B-59395 TaxID=644548 RepID=F1YH56_9ACTN|nr:ABC transporter substrate-binding protein [Gordonia neofelifaecis]EGD55971.1 branched-chain amino acid transport system substrate-binding protein [Gordonia neofelifaecis NRRL B-59395]
MRIRNRAIIVGLAVSSLTLAACGNSDSTSSGGADQPYRVLITAGISGQGALAANAQTSVLAAKAGVQVVNNDGGIDGRKIQLTVVDDGGDATNAVTKIRQSITESKPDLVLDSGPSTISAALLPILKQNKILSFNVAPTEDSTNPDKFPLNFDLAPGGTDNSKSIAGYAKEKNYNDIGVIHGSTAYGEEFGEKMGQAVTAAGLKLAGNVEYEVTALDMTAQLQSLKNAGAKALVVDAYGAPLGYLLKNIERLGWDVPIIGNTSVSGTNLIANTPPAGVLGTPAVKNLVTQVFTSTVYDPNNAAVKQMVDTMASLGEIRSTLIVADNYDAMPLIAAAAKKAGTSTDPQKLAEALENPEVQQNAKTAFLARYNFTADSHDPNPAQSEMKFIAPTKVVNGQFGHP